MRIGSVFSGLFIVVIMLRVEQRRFGPRIRAAGRSLSRRRNLVVRASPTSLPNSWLERRTQKRETGRSGIELAAQNFLFWKSSRKPETSPLLVPIERQSRVIEELARVQFGRMLPGEDCADNVRRQQRETEQPCHVGRDY